VPFKHQLSEFEATRHLEFWGLFWEMGVAKSKLLIDTAAWLWLQGKIDGLLIIAPEGVNAQWINDEIPMHMPMIVQDSMDRFGWVTSKQINKGFQEKWRMFLERPRGKGLSVLTMTYDALMTQRMPKDPKGIHKGADGAKAFLLSRRCLLVLDESTEIKTAGAQITKRVLAMSKYAPYRRLANGTPISDSPFQAYTQIKFLNQDAWRHLGISDAQGFKTYFGSYEKRQLRSPKRVVSKNGGRAWMMTHFDQLVGYRNLDTLAAVVKAHGSRLLKSTVFPDLPPKLYSKHYFELAPKQRKVYDELKESMRTWLESGEEVTAVLAIVRQTRLQQICSGYLPADDERLLRPLIDPKDNPRLHLLREVLEEVPGKVIIWGKYDIDVDLISQTVREHLGWDTVVWDGRTTDADKATAKSRFLDPNGPRAFIGKASSSAARGLNLQVADTVVYYNNSFVLDDRQQSEDRAHRPGIHHPVKYIDLIGNKTIDEHILSSLRKKRDVAAIVTGDQLSEWV
jgi:hypothetical protein